MQIKCELLVPAGGMAQLKAAVNAGADAVYLGGTQYSARANAGNFQDDEMILALDYAHVRNVNVYVAMNTLLSNEELPAALNYAKFLYEAGADALIIQDIGLASLVKKHLPGIKTHLSTQGTVYNVEGVKAAKQLGFSRVVLAREMSLEEIKQAARANIIETEVFVHGALCICYSGQCQMSRHIGGRSANRGQCAQPCRLPYSIPHEKKRPAEGRHVLSPKDYCAADHLGDLIESGVASLKIEGRMKSPEYVAIVTSIYRKYLDMYQRDGSYTVSKEDKLALAQIFNRGGFTDGYLYRNPGTELMSTVMPKHQGVYIGKIHEAHGNSQLVDVALAQGAHLGIGDGVEIRSELLTGNVVTYYKDLKENVCRIGDIKGKVSKGDAVYKITDKSLMDGAKPYFDEGVAWRGKKIPICLEFRAWLGEFPELVVREIRRESGGNDGRKETPALVTYIRGEDCKAQRAINKAITHEIIEKQLRKTAEFPFRAEDIKIEIDEGISLPVSAINRLRRDALADFEARRASSRRREAPADASLWAQAALPMCAGGGPGHRGVRESSISLFFFEARGLEQKKLRGILSRLGENGVNADKVKAFVPLYEFMETEVADMCGLAEIVPYILNVSKGKADEYIRSNFARIVERCGKCGISIGNIGWIQPFASQGVSVYGDYGLNITNAEAEKALFGLGMGVAACSSLENGECFGSIPLMISEHMLDKIRLTDRKGDEYPIMKNGFGDKCMILSGDKAGDCLDYMKIKRLWERGENIRIFLT